MGHGASMDVEAGSATHVLERAFLGPSERIEPDRRLRETRMVNDPHSIVADRKRADILLALCRRVIAATLAASTPNEKRSEPIAVDHSEGSVTL